MNKPITTEKPVEKEIVVRAFQMGFALWRNNSGALPNQNGVPVRFGLGNDSKKFNEVWKSLDLVGIGPYGRFLTVDAKPPGWTRPRNKRERAQQAHIDEVNMRGGIAFFATSVQDFENQLKKVML